jgi:methyl-accepting chemotaxis protein
MPKLIGGLQRRILFYFLPLSVLIVAIFLIFFYNQTSSITKREFIENGKALAKNFAFNCQAGIETNNEGLLHLPILALAQEENVDYVMIYDSLGEIVTTFIKEEGTEPSLAPGQLIRIRKGKIGLVMPGKVYSFLAPVARRNPDGNILESLEQSDVIGIVRIGISTVPLKALIQRSLRRGLIFGVITIILVFVVSVILSRQITQPATAISREMEAIAHGEADLSKRLVVRRHDEIGALADGFNNFIETLAKIIREVTESTPKLSEQSNHLASISQELTAATQEITASVQQIAQSSGTQLKDIYKILDDAKSTKEIAKDTVDSALHSKDTFDKILHLSNEGKNEAEAATQNIGVIMSGIEHLTERINLLYAETEKIPTIVDTINSIAEKTALLALNAAIEAARAGEAGRGFTIVAQEVTKLSEMSRTQAEEINKIISNIIEKTGVMVKEADDTFKGVRHSKDVLLNASERLKNIAKEIINAVADIDLIVKKGEANKEAVNRLVTILDEIARESQTNASAAEEVSASIEEQGAAFSQLLESTQILTAIADKLKEQSGRFKV